MKKDYLKAMGNRIRDRRIELNMSQDDLADALGFKNRSSVARIENGETDLTQTKAKKVANILKLDVNYIIFGVGEEDRNNIIRLDELNDLDREIIKIVIKDLQFSDKVTLLSDLYKKIGR